MPRPFRKSASSSPSGALQNWCLSSGKQRFDSARHLAAALGISTYSLSRYFSGDRFPNPAQRGELHRLTGLNCFKSVVLRKMHPCKGESEKTSHSPFAVQLNAWFDAQDQFT